MTLVDILKLLIAWGTKLNNWLKVATLIVTILLSALASVLATTAISQVPYSGVTNPVAEPRPIAPASPAGTVRVEVCEQARVVTVVVDPISGFDRYSAVGPVTLLWPDSPKADLERGVWNPKALLEGEVADMTADVIKCLYRRAERILPTAAIPRMLNPAMYFPIPRTWFPRMLAMERDGTWSWSYEQWQAGGDILGAVATAFDDTSARYGVYFVYDQASGQRNISTSGSPFVARCGAGFAVACVGPDPPYYPLSADAYYDGPYMATFYFQSQRGIPKHEWMHVSTRRAEGTPSGTWAEGCVAFPSVMGCGPGSPKDYTSLDDAAWAEEHYPRSVSWAFVSREWNAVFYGATPTNDNGSTPATRVALIGCDQARGCFWSGYYGLPTYGKAIEAIPLPSLVGVCWSIKTENALSWQWSESVTFAGCVP